MAEDESFVDKSNGNDQNQSPPPPASRISSRTLDSSTAALSDLNRNKIALSASRNHKLSRRSQSITSPSTDPRLSTVKTYLPPFQVVYGANSVASEESARVMSEKVQILAASIYKELETLIQKHGEESVKVCYH